MLPKKSVSGKSFKPTAALIASEELVIRKSRFRKFRKPISPDAVRL